MGHWPQRPGQSQSVNLEQLTHQHSLKSGGWPGFEPGSLTFMASALTTKLPTKLGTDGSMPRALGAQMKDLFLRSTPVFGAEMVGCVFLVPKEIHRPRGRDGGLGPGPSSALTVWRTTRDAS